ncbi:MAG: DoxX family protein [Anaerolineales bacterium]|nr:DoxX family protein [Anaerolineales bacterium]
MATQTLSKDYRLADPQIMTSLFNSVYMSWLWLAVRLYLGYTWITSGWGKLGNPAWMQTGDALKGFWGRAVLIPEAPARPAIAFNWYRSFIQFMLDSGSYTWFAKLVAIGEVVISIALVLGIFTWIFAFLGGFMNWNFMMAGRASVNPVMLILSILLILAWKTAGWLGLDRWLLVQVGTPWQPGLIFQRKQPQDTLIKNPPAATCGRIEIFQEADMSNSKINRMDDNNRVDNSAYRRSWNWGGVIYWAVREGQEQIGWPGGR